MQRITETGSETITISPENMPTSESLSTTTDKCPICGGSGFTENDQYCNCARGRFQREKEELDDAKFHKEYAENLFRIANIPVRFGRASASDYDEGYFMNITKEIDVKGGAGLFLWGPVGSGKTHLAAAILRELLELNNMQNVALTNDGFRDHFLFMQVPDLLDKIRSGYEDRRTNAEDWLDRASEASLLVLDDIGAERVTDWVREKLFQLVNRRYNNVRATIVTSNLSPDELSQHIGDRTVSRLIEMCKVIHLTGEDRRLKKR